MSLPDAFKELRRVDREQTPPFERMWNASRVRPRRRSWTFAIAACALVVLIATSIVMLRREPKPEIVSMPLHWRGPTDFLLDTPGSSLMRGVPQLPSPVPNYSLKGNAK